MHEKHSGIKYIKRILLAYQWLCFSYICNALSSSDKSTRDFVDKTISPPKKAKYDELTYTNWNYEDEQFASSQRFFLVHLSLLWSLFSLQVVSRRKPGLPSRSSCFWSLDWYVYLIHKIGLSTSYFTFLSSILEDVYAKSIERMFTLKKKFHDLSSLLWNNAWRYKSQRGLMKRTRTHLLIDDYLTSIYIHDEMQSLKN